MLPEPLDTMLVPWFTWMQDHFEHQNDVLWLKMSQGQGLPGDEYVLTADRQC